MEEEIIEEIIEPEPIWLIINGSLDDLIALNEELLTMHKYIPYRTTIDGVNLVRKALVDDLENWYEANDFLKSLTPYDGIPEFPTDEE